MGDRRQRLIVSLLLGAVLVLLHYHAELGFLSFLALPGFWVAVLIAGGGVHGDRNVTVAMDLINLGIYSGLIYASLSLWAHRVQAKRSRR